MGAGARALPILTYHRVGLPPPHSTCRGLFTSPRHLERHLRLLRRLGYGFITFDELAGALDNGAPLPKKPVILTFDDGHCDNLGVQPLLQKYGAAATVFVLAGEMGVQGATWAEASERAPTDLLSWDQARILHRGGWRIESHGLTHRHLDRLEPQEVDTELRVSRERIAAEVGRLPLAHAYPYGAATPAVRAAARRAGYRFACSTEKGVNERAALDPWSLRRIPVKGFRRVHLVRFALAALRGFA